MAALGWADEQKLLKSGAPGCHGLPFRESQRRPQPESCPPKLLRAGRGRTSWQRQDRAREGREPRRPPS